tara:strand:- start:2212 stop:2496 length:285 start_codon:yes stop_codon:yes gene_type:complete
MRKPPTPAQIKAIKAKWNNSSVEKRKEMIIKTHNAFTDGHWEQLNRNWDGLQSVTSNAIIRNYAETKKPLDKGTKEFYKSQKVLGTGLTQRGKQ